LCARHVNLEIDLINFNDSCSLGSPLLRLLVVVAAAKEIGKWIGAVNLWLGREKLHLSHRTAM
jgi:hypothetical protein